MKITPTNWTNVPKALKANEKGEAIIKSKFKNEGETR
jgi:hypothetical protein